MNGSEMHFYEEWIEKIKRRGNKIDKIFGRGYKIQLYLMIRNKEGYQSMKGWKKQVPISFSQLIKNKTIKSSKNKRKLISSPFLVKLRSHISLAPKKSFFFQKTFYVQIAQSEQNPKYHTLNRLKDIFQTKSQTKNYFSKKFLFQSKKKPKIKTSQSTQESEYKNNQQNQMSQIENTLPFQFPFSNTANAFEQFDFSLKKTDSCDYLNLGNAINAPLASLTQNKSILNNNFNNCKAQNTQNDMTQFPWMNHHEQENNFGNIFQEANNFSLNYVSSFPAVNEARKNYHNTNDDYDFMNLNSDDNDNHFDNISNPFNNDNDFFQRSNIDSEFEQFKTNQSFFNQGLNEQKNQQTNFFDQQTQVQGQKHQQGSSNIDSQNSLGEANLLKIDDFKEMPFEMIIEPYSEEEQRQLREENEKREKDGQPKISERDLHGRKYEKIIQKRRDYDKNICRYIARQMMRCFISEEYKEIILKRFCSENEEIYEKIIPFIRSSIPKISGHRAFKDLLAILKEEENDVKEWKMIFRKFSKWFLRERSLRYIMLGNSEDKTQYIRFKNQVMLHFINKPEQWNANLKINPYPFKVRNMSYNQYANPVYQDTTTSSQEQF